MPRSGRKRSRDCRAAGHDVDLIDLYADRFDPVLSEEARRHYHDASRNQAGLEDYVRRLKSADALVVQFPVWCFGMPAMLKGFFDRMILPGVAFDISDPVNVKPMLGNLKHLAGIVTYGRRAGRRSRWATRRARPSSATCAGLPTAARAWTTTRSIT